MRHRSIFMIINREAMIRNRYNYLTPSVKTTNGKKDALKAPTPTVCPQNIGQMAIQNKNFTRTYMQRHTMTEIVNNSRSTALERSVNSLTGGLKSILRGHNPRPFSFAVRKVDDRIWALKYAKRPSIAKRTLTAKKVLYAIFFRNSGPLMQIAVSKGRSVSGSFYKNVVLKQLRTKMRKVCAKTGLQHVHLLEDKAPAHKSWTIA